MAQLIFNISLITICLSNILFGQINHEAIKLAKAIGNRVINETSFNLEEIDQKPVLNIQVVDFNKIKLISKTKFLVSESILENKIDTKLLFGVSFDNPIKIYIDNKLIFQKTKKEKFRFQEVAYEIFEFQNSFSVDLKSGKHQIKIVCNSNAPAKIYLREITKVGVEPKSTFISPHPNKQSTWNWCYYASPNELTQNHENCIVPEANKLKRVVIPTSNIYGRESYCEWQYPNGSLLLSLLGLAKNSDDIQFKQFVQKCADFTVDNYELFRKQYFELDDLRGTNHKMFRKSMLDDTGSPSLHLLQLAIDDGTKKYDFIINQMIDYISKKQVRLKDGTFCRPEPYKYVIWADDLFMSVPFLLRVGLIKNEKKFFDDAARQIINFNKYLLDKKSGLYKHVWYDNRKKQSQISWGRANGWIIWAESEALMLLSPKHKDYEAIKNIFKEHISSLVKYQGANGLWHQLLDDSSTFEETSCTAMFVIGIIRGIELKILDESFSTYVKKAWYGLRSKISNDGIVTDICRGTGVSDDINFYKTRERFPNDPRGLGAVITALYEIANYFSEK